MLRGLLLTLLFMTFVMLPASVEALEPDPAGAPFKAELGAPPPPPGDVQGPGSRRRAGPCRHGRGSHPARMLLSERARRQLGLSEEQSSRLRQLSLEARKNAIRRRADLETKQLELEELLGAAEPDRAAIDRTVQEIGTLHAAQMKADIDQRLNFQDVLTPEQRDKLREFREQGFRGRRSGREAGKWKHGDSPGSPPWAPSEPDPPPSPPEQ